MSIHKNYIKNPIPKYLRPELPPALQEMKNERQAQRTALYNPSLRRIRRRQMVMARVAGLNNQRIGEIFGLRAKTVSREIRIAEKDGTLEQLNTRIIEELVPEALEVFLYKMREEKDAFVAKEVLKHLERLTARKDEQDSAKTGQVSMKAYIEEKRQLATGQFVTIEQKVEGEVARAFLEEGRLEAAEPERMAFLNDIVVEKVDE